MKRTTNVRRRSSWWWLLTTLPFLAIPFLRIGSDFNLIALIVPFTIFALMTVAREREAEIDASAEGLRIDGKLVPRSKLVSAMLHHEGSRTFVSFRGKRGIDVEVPNNIEGDALIRSLGLDAAHAAIELTLFSPAKIGPASLALIAILLAALLFALVAHSSAGVMILAIAAVASFVAAMLSTGTRLRVGADGITVRHTLGTPRFIPHDAITRVSAEGETITIETTSVGTLRMALPPARVQETQEQRDERTDQTANIVRRIEQARQAFRDLGGNVPELATVLERKARTTRDWRADLERVGRGATAAYREVGATREQLLALAESTAATARERIAAIVALKRTLTEEEKPRIRVAADRCAEPELGARMVRVLDTDDDAVLEDALDATERDHEA